MSFVGTFFAGAFLCNCIPHLACGLQGLGFPTPFAKPRGVGFSSPFINFLWGTFNLLVGCYLFSGHPVSIQLTPDFAVFCAGFLLLGTYLSIHFERVHARRVAK